VAVLLVDCPRDRSGVASSNDRATNPCSLFTPDGLL
jgi:hypothetical protein